MPLKFKTNVSITFPEGGIVQNFLIGANLSVFQHLIVIAVVGRNF